MRTANYIIYGGDNEDGQEGAEILMQADALVAREYSRIKKNVHGCQKEISLGWIKRHTQGGTGCNILSNEEGFTSGDQEEM